MKKYSFKSIVGGAAFALSLSFALLFATHASAMIPTVSVSNNGYGGYGSMQVTVYGDANASVILDYYSGNQLVGAGVIGYTNSNGSFSGTINPSVYPIPNGAEAVVIVDQQQSSPFLWQSTGGGTIPIVPTPVLSQANAVLTVGQSQVIAITNPSGYYTQYYVSNTSNGIVTTTVNGSQITLYGQAAGTTTVSVCSNNSGLSYGYNSGCATLNVTVTGSNYYPPTYPTYPPACPVYSSGYTSVPNCPCYPTYNTPLSASNSNVQLTVGNTGTVTIYGNNGYAYPATNNSYYGGSTGFYVTTANNGIASATMNGNTVSIYAIAPGITTLTVCQASTSQCVSINVTVAAPIVYNYNNNYPYNISNYDYDDYPQQNNQSWYYSNTQHCWLHY